MNGTTEQHQPGEWPEDCRRNAFADEAWLKVQAERAEQNIILGRIGAYMEAQPSPHAVRAYGRRWASNIMQLSNAVADAKAKEASK